MAKGQVRVSNGVMNSCTSLRGLGVETAAHVAAEDELPIPVKARHQGSEQHARSPRLRVSAYHHFLAQLPFDLEPVRAAAAAVGRGFQLGHHALESQVHGLIEYGRPIALETLRIP